MHTSPVPHLFSCLFHVINHPRLFLFTSSLFHISPLHSPHQQVTSFSPTPISFFSSSSSSITTHMHIPPIFSPSPLTTPSPSLILTSHPLHHRPHKQSRFSHPRSTNILTRTLTTEGHTARISLHINTTYTQDYLNHYMYTKCQPTTHISTVHNKRRNATIQTNTPHTHHSSSHTSYITTYTLILLFLYALLSPLNQHFSHPNHYITHINHNFLDPQQATSQLSLNHEHATYIHSTYLLLPTTTHLLCSICRYYTI